MRKDASFRERKVPFRERKVPFAKERFWLRKEDIYKKYFKKLYIVLIVGTLNPKKCNFNAPAIRKNFFSKFDKYNILALS